MHAFGWARGADASARLPMRVMGPVAALTYGLIILMRSIIIQVMMTPTHAPLDFSRTLRKKRLVQPLRIGRRAAGIPASCLTAVLLLSAVSRAEEPAIEIKIRDHRFVPAEIEIPAGEKRLLIIENEDATVEEFESHSLHREKIIAPHAKASVYVGPLKPGRYEFQGEYNEPTAKGAIVAK